MANEGKTIFSDILTFMWCKMKLCPRDTLLQVTKAFYKRDEVIEARDLLYEKYPGVSGGSRRVKHKKTEDDLISMYNILQEADTEDPPVFATTNLNNIPYVDLKNIDGVSLLYKQSKMDDQLQDVLHQQAAMQAQFVEMLDFIKKMDNAARPMAVDLARPQYSEICKQALPGDVGTQNRHISSLPSSSSRISEKVDDLIKGHRHSSQVNSQTLKSTSPVELGDSREDGNGRGTEGTRVSSRYVRDSDGFIHRDIIKTSKRLPKPLTTGRKMGTKLKVAPTVQRAKVFVSRLHPDFPVEELREFVRELTGTDCEIDRLKTKYPSYSSFVISCEKQFESVLLDPDEWEKGIIIRPFYGKVLKKADDDSVEINA